jgi:uncharacterized protein YbbC (DUF1343 family)
MVSSPSSPTRRETHVGSSGETQMKMPTVLSGLDRWIADSGPNVDLANGSRLGVVAHPASVDRRGRHIIDWLHASDAHDVARIFAPEHGLWGHEQDMEPVSESVDGWTGLPVVSLYGQDRDSLRPRQEHLAGLDAIVVDLQDVGSRYYTFIYTLSYVMDAASEAGLPVLVLDRPNPIGGDRVEGPVLDPKLSSFVGRYALPVRHGMTIAELAGLFRSRHGANCKLNVVPMEGWRRSMQFEETGLPWVPPSPNMPTTATARVYPGGCLVEGTNLSEGRGTTLPFEFVGAPWIDGRDLAARAFNAGLPGVVFRPTSFRPMFQKHAGEACGGVHVIVTDRKAFRPFATYLVLLREARNLDTGRFAWRTETYEFETERPAIDYLLGVDGLREMLERGTEVDEMEATWRSGTESFLAIRDEFLLYD